MNSIEEKAKELFVSYLKIAVGKSMMAQSQDYNKAKLCTLKSIDEILEVLSTNLNVANLSSVLIYWLKIRREIEDKYQRDSEETGIFTLLYKRD